MTKTREQYIVIRRLAAKRGAVTKKINALVGAGVSIDSPEVRELLKEDEDIADSIKTVGAVSQGPKLSKAGKP